MTSTRAIDHVRHAGMIVTQNTDDDDLHDVFFSQRAAFILCQFRDTDRAQEHYSNIVLMMALW